MPSSLAGSDDSGSDDSDDSDDNDPLGLQVFCVDCVSISNFSVGIEMNFTGLSITKAYINVTVDDFQHNIKLEFSMNDTAQYQKTLDVLLLAIPDLGISVRSTQI